MLCSQPPMDHLLCNRSEPNEAKLLTDKLWKQLELNALGEKGAVVTRHHKKGLGE